MTDTLKGCEIERGKESRLAEYEDRDFLFPLYQFPFLVYFSCVVFQVYESGSSVGVHPESTWARNEAASLPALFEEGAGQE